MDLICTETLFPEHYLYQKPSINLSETFQRISLSAILENPSVELGSMCWVRLRYSECQILLIYGPNCIVCCRTFPSFQIHCILYLRDENLGEFSQISTIDNKNEDEDMDYLLVSTTTGLYCYLKWVDKPTRKFTQPTKDIMIHSIKDHVIHDESLIDTDYIPPSYKSKPEFEMYISSEGNYCCYLEMTSVKRFPRNFHQIIHNVSIQDYENVILGIVKNGSSTILQWMNPKPLEIIKTITLAFNIDVIIPLSHIDYCLFIVKEYNRACLVYHKNDIGNILQLSYLPSDSLPINGVYIDSYFVCMIYKTCIYAIHIPTFKRIFCYSIPLNDNDSFTGEVIWTLNNLIVTKKDNSIISLDFNGNVIFKIDQFCSIKKFILSPCGYYMFILNKERDVIIVNMTKKTRNGIVGHLGWWDINIDKLDQNICLTFHSIPFQYYSKHGPVKAISEIKGRYVFILGHEWYFKDPGILIFDTSLSTWNHISFMMHRKIPQKYIENIIYTCFINEDLVIISKNGVIIIDYSDINDPKYSEIHQQDIVAADHNSGYLYLATRDFIAIVDIASKSKLDCSEKYQLKKWIKGHVYQLKHIRNDRFLACLQHECIALISLNVSSMINSCITPLKTYQIYNCHCHCQNNISILITQTISEIQIWISEDCDFYSEPDLVIKMIDGFPFGICFNHGYVLIMQYGILQKQLFVSELIIFLFENKITSLIFHICKIYYPLSHFGFILEATLYKFIERLKKSKYSEIDNRNLLIEMVEIIKSLCRESSLFYGHVIVSVLRKLDHTIWLPMYHLLFPQNDHMHPFAFLKECLEEKEWTIAVNYLPILSLVLGYDEVYYENIDGHERKSLEDLLSLLLSNIQDSQLLEQLEQFIEKRKQKNQLEERSASLLNSLMSVLLID